jgi:prevent-host-death family protein
MPAGVGRGQGAMPKIMGVTKARIAFTEIVNEADAHGEPIYLTNFNEPRAVLIGYEAWEALIERLEDLEDVVLFHARQDEPSRSIEDFLTVMEQEKSPRGQTSLSRTAEAVR